MQRMISTTVLFLSILLTLGHLPAFAGEKSGPAYDLTLSEAIATSLAKNPQIAASRSGVNAAAAKITEARSGFFPRVNLSESFQRTTNPMWAFGTKLNQESITQQDFDPARLNNPSPINNYASAITLSWPLFDGGQTWFGTSQAKLAYQAEQMALERTRQEVIGRTVKAYLGLVLAQENVTITNQALATARAHLKMIENRYKKGLVVKSDVLRTQVHIAELEQDRVEATSGVSVARAALCAVMGISMGQPLEPVTPMPKTSVADKKLDAWVKTALAKRPDLKQLDFQEQVTRDQIKKSRAANLPSVNLNGSYEYNSERFDNNADNYTIGADITLNLFSGFKYSSQTRQALFRHQQVLDQKRAVQQQIRLQVEQAYYDICSAEKRIDAAKTSVDQAEEAMRIIQNRYKNGLVSIVSLLDAELAVYRARNNYNRALYDHTMARARLAEAEGTLNKNFH